MKTDIDSLLQAEKQTLNVRRQRQKKILRVVAIFFSCMFLAGIAILLFTLQRQLSRQQLYTMILQSLGVGAVSGAIEYIKIKIKGQERSLLFEALQLCVFIICILILAQLWKTT